MAATRTFKLLLLFLFVFLQTGIHSFSQSTSFPYSNWTEKLSDQYGPANSGVDEILSMLMKTDSIQANAALNELEKRGKRAGKYFIPRFNYLKASWLYSSKGCIVSGLLSELMKKALNGAYDTNDDSLISNISWYYGGFMYACRAIEPAAMYCLYSVELAEKAGIKSDVNRITLLGSILYTTRDYENSIFYTRQAIERYPDTSTMIKKAEVLSRWNTIALCWQKIGNYDSAFHYYNIALQIARELNNYVWIGIISGNIGQVYYLQGKYDLAKPLLEFDYRESKKYGEPASAANSLQWAARINLAQGKKDSALMQVEKALQQREIYYEPVYLQNVSYTAAEIYRAFGRNDSVIKYLEIYNRLHDSIERAVANSSLEIARIKLENLQSTITIKNLHKEKEEQKLIRNFILVAIVMMAIIVMLVLNRQKQKLVHQQQLVKQQKAAAEIEMTSAKEQLKLFTGNIVEKTSLIEKLEKEIQSKEFSAQQQQMVDELSQLTILTEDEWLNFKTLYEKIYPGFFIRLKEKAPDISLAEQRMAALTRLHLTSKQIASMVGISADSVRKARLRLRHRLELNIDSNIEDILASL